MLRCSDCETLVYGKHESNIKDICSALHHWPITTECHAMINFSDDISYFNVRARPFYNSNPTKIPCIVTAILELKYYTIQWSEINNISSHKFEWDKTTHTHTSTHKKHSNKWSTIANNNKKLLQFTEKEMQFNI